MVKHPALILPLPLFICIFIVEVVLASDLPTESHPSILYDSEMVAILCARIEREPYLNWWSDLEDLAISALDFNLGGATEYQKSRNCKFLAFAYEISDSLPYAEKCLEGLESIDVNGNWGGTNDYYAHADPLTFYCEAYDILKGSGYEMGESEPLIRANLAQKAQEFQDNLWIQFYINNWKVRYFAALGIAAMTLSDHPDAESWHDEAEAQVMSVFNSYQVAGEGSWAEGPYYLLYSAKIYLPYMLAYQRLIEQEGLLEKPAVHMVHDWSWRIRMPDGRRPNFEDSHLTYFFGDYLATVYDNPGVYQWDYESVMDPDSLYAPEDWLVDAICYYDDAIESSQPSTQATVFLPEAGQTVFRSGWDADDVFLFLIGEHGAARINGQGHDHADATSFILCACGEILCLDAGYISWELRGSVNKASNHSLILIDGQGPPTSTPLSAGDADAYLKDFYTIGGLQFCTDSTFYQGVGVERSVLFIDSSFFLIRDRLTSARQHVYDWRLHGNGGGTSGGEFTLEADGAAWHREGASVYTVLDANTDLTFSATSDTHSFGYNQILTHSTLDVQAAGTDVDFLATIYPVPADSPEPAMNKLNSPEGMAFLFDDGIALSSHSGDTCILPDSLTGFPTLETDADFLYASIADGQIVRHAIHQGQWLTFGGIEYFTADAYVALALERTGEIWEGYAQGEGTYHICLYMGDVEALSVTFNGSPASLNYQNPAPQITLDGEGYLDIQVGQRLILSADSLNFPETEVGGSSVLPLSLHNNGSTDLIIYGISNALLPIFSNDWNANDSLLVPGDSMEIEVTFTPESVETYLDSLVVLYYFGAEAVCLKGAGVPSSSVQRPWNDATQSPLFPPPHPNPANQSVTFSFELLHPETVSLIVYDLTGREVIHLIDQHLAAGAHQATFEGTGLASGIYIARIKAGQTRRVQKFVLIR